MAGPAFIGSEVTIPNDNGEQETSSNKKVRKTPEEEVIDNPTMSAPHVEDFPTISSFLDEALKEVKSKDKSNLVSTFFY